MKNLWKAADGKKLNSKFIWQNAESMHIGYENREQIHADTHERLEHLKKSVSSVAVLEKQIASKSADIMKDIISLLDEPEKNAGKIAELTKSKALGDREKNNMLRTEVVARLNDYLGGINGGIALEEGSEILVKSMKQMSYPKWYKTEQKLRDASNMIKYGESKLTPAVLRRFRGAERYKLANQMDKDGQNVGFDVKGALNKKIDGVQYEVERFEVLTGAAMTHVDTNLLSKFVVEKAILVDGPNGPQIIATMKNGCEGNFVIIDLKKEKDVVDLCPDGSAPWYDKSGVRHCGPSNCMSCERVGAVVSADVASEMFEGNFLLGENPCDKPNFERNFAKMEELGVFDASLVDKVANWDSLDAKGKWNSMSPDDQKMAVAQYQHEIASEGLTRVEKFFNSVFEENGMKDKLEAIQNGRLLEGGVLGWLEQIPKIFQNKDRATVRRITRKLGISQDDYNLMMEKGSADIAESTNRGRHTMEELQAKLDAMSPEKRKRVIANAKKNASSLGALTTFDKFMRGGSAAQVGKMLLPDMLVIAASFGTDVPLTNIRLPRWMGTKIQQLPGLNAIAKTKLGNEIGNNYTKFQQEVIARLDKEIQLTDNVAQLSAELMQTIAVRKQLNECNDPALLAKIDAKIDKQNARLDVLVKNMEETIDKLVNAVEKREQAWKNESKSTRRHSYKFLENTDGRRKETRQSVRVIRKALRESKSGDKSDLTSPEVIGAMETVQKNLLAEINDDFGSNVDFAGFGKEITNARSFDLNIKRGLARNLSVKMKIEEHDGKQELVADYYSVKFGKKSWEDMNERQRNKATRLINKYAQDFQDRMAEVQELHGISTVINEYSKATNVRKVRSKIYSMEGNNSALENVRESSSYATLMRMERDSATKEAILGTNCAESDCWFDSDMRGKLETFFAIDESVDPTGKEAAFKQLQKDGFETQYNEMIQKVGEFMKGLESYTDADGLVRYDIRKADGSLCSPRDVKSVIKKGEALYISDKLTGVIQKRFPVAVGIKTVKESISNEKFIGKDEGALWLENTQGPDAALAYIQEQYGSDILNYAVQTTADGTAVTGIKLIMKNGVKRVLDFSLKQSLQNGLRTAIASGIGQRLKNSNYQTTYAQKDVNDYSKYVASTPKSDTNNNVTVNGAKKVRTVDDKGNVTYKTINKTVKTTAKVTKSVETNSDLMSQLQMLSGDGDGIKRFAEEHSDMFSANILEDIRNFPANSIVSMSKILLDAKGKIIELAANVDCSKCKPVNGKTLTSYEITNGAKVSTKKNELITTTESIETLSKVIGKYTDLPNNAVSVQELKHQRVLITLANGKSIKGHYDSDETDTVRTVKLSNVK